MPGGRPSELEVLRELFKDTRVWISLARIDKLELSEDRSSWAAQLTLLPEEYEVVARMTWGQVGPDSGIYGPASIGDLVIVAMADDNEAWVLGRVSNNEDTIPQQAADGHNINKSLAGKKNYICSDTMILLGKGLETDPDEPVVLGNVLKSLLSYVLAQLSDQADKLSVLSDDLSKHTHTGNFGGSTPLEPPYVANFTTKKTEFTTKKTNFNDKKASPVDDNAINSDLSFTEKGA